MAKSSEHKTVKQERAERRAEKVRAYQEAQAAAKRRRRIGIVSASVGGAAVLALMVGFIVTSGSEQTRPEDINIAGLQEFPNLPAAHVSPNP